MNDQSVFTTMESKAEFVEALVIGAGFGGMYALHRLRNNGTSVRGIEAGGDVGGTWYWNRYPGARVDVMSIDYSYSFSEEIQQEWTWSEAYAEGPEILSYANFVADRLDLRRDIQFNTRVLSVVFNDSKKRWVVKTDQGHCIEATYCVMATGPLSIPKPIDIPGADAFEGELYQSGKWPHHKVEFSGRRVGVVGTGSSGIQIVPVVAEAADKVCVFQRTPSFTLPMRNRKLDPEYVAQVKQHYSDLRTAAKNSFTGGVRNFSSRPFFSVPADERLELMEQAWRRGTLLLMTTFSDVMSNQAANDIVADFVRDKIGEVVTDPLVAEKLKPRGYPIFAKRPCIDTNYYESFNRENVELFDCLTNPIVEFTKTGVRTTTSKVELDIIILATGYDGLTGAMLAIDVRGREGQSLADKWSEGSKSYLGLAMNGFPNLFMIAGANGPSAFANFIILDEQNVDWIVDCINYMKDRDLKTIEPTDEAEQEWMEEVARLANLTLFPKANTWYTGTNIIGKPRFFGIYMGGFGKYREICSEVSRSGYRGFELS